MYNILLVEDEKDTARCVKEAFELEDIAVDVAYDGREGLNKFHEKEYDLILLDLQMPLMTGEELLHEVRKENPYIEIVALPLIRDASFCKRKTIAEIHIGQRQRMRV